VLHPPADEHGDVGSGDGRDPLGDLAQPVQRLGRLHQDDPRARGHLAQRQGAVRPGQAGALGVAEQRPLPDQQVLGHADVRGAVQGDRAEGQRAVGVVDDRHLAGPAQRQRGGRLVEQQAVGRVDGDQFRRLHVGSAPELGEEVGCVGHRRQASRVARRAGEAGGRIGACP
jgi:hypothetical protein